MEEIKGITFSDGTIFAIDTAEDNLIGYQIVHKLTKRILPGTQRHEIYTKAAAIRKMNKVAGQYTLMHVQLDIWDYNLSPMYKGDIDDYIIITDVNDKLY